MTRIGEPPGSLNFRGKLAEIDPSHFRWFAPSVDGVQTRVVAGLLQTDGNKLSDVMRMQERVKATVVGAILFQPLGRK